ncbi:MAG: hypothetical protein QG646_3250 [Euryarchaeota archaeon]|nr:hypothetical protein [Euryarchaeota archaeon]
MLQKNVYSNYSLNLEHYRLESLDDLDEVRDGLLVLDELWYTIDSRSANTKENKYSSVVLSKSRKRNLHISYSEQGFDLVDRRFRDRTRIIFLPKLDRPKNPRFLKVEIYKRNKFGEFQKVSKVLLFSLEKILKKFDTNEELAPMKLESR